MVDEHTWAAALFLAQKRCAGAPSPYCFAQSMPRVGASTKALFPFGASSALAFGSAAAMLGDRAARSKAVHRARGRTNLERMVRIRKVEASSRDTPRMLKRAQFAGAIAVSSGDVKAIMPRSTTKRTTASAPAPVLRLVNTNGRSPRIRLASRAMTSNDAPTIGAR